MQEFGCIGSLVLDDEMGQVIQMSGDQREKVKNFLVIEGICSKDKVKIHGF